MFGRKLRSQLDLLKPNLAKAADETPDRQEVAHDKQATPRRFHVGDCVYARNYSSGPKWLPGQVVQVEGSALYHVKLKDGRVQCRHIDQLRSRPPDSEDATRSSDTELDSGPQLTDSGLTDQETVTDSQELTSDPPTDSSNAPEPETTTAQPETDELVPNSAPAHDSTQESSEPENEPPPTNLRRSTRTRQPPQRYDELTY